MDVVLLLFGIAAMVGIWLTGLLVDHWLRAMALISLSAFAVAALILGFSGGSTAIVLVGIAIWGLTFGGAPIMLQTALAGAAGENADVAQSMFVTIFNLAVAGGGVIGALLLNRIGAVSFPWAVLALALLGLSIVWSAKTNGFRAKNLDAAT